MVGTFTVELQQVGSLVSPPAAALLITIGIVVFAILGRRFMRRWRNYGSS